MNDMTKETSNLPIEQYTTDYLDSVRARFPELANASRQELVDMLESNQERKHGEYEFMIKDALDNIDEEAVLNYPDESLFTYLFEELPQNESNSIQQGITHVIQTSTGSGDLVLGAWTGPKSQDRAKTIGPATFVDDYTLIQTGNASYFSRGDENKYVVILSIKKTGEQDVYGRKSYTLTPTLLQVPDSGAMLMNGMLFKKELTVAEFKESFAKCSTPNN